MNKKSTVFNPFDGKDSKEVWRELRKVAVLVDKTTAMKQITERKKTFN